MRRLVVCAVVAVCVLTVAFFGGGYVLFTRPHGDAVTKADAIVVLGGEPDGRIEYGLELGRQGYADTVVISDAWGDNDGEINQACSSGTDTLSVICFVPDPFSTRGEAMFTAKLAREHGWTHVIVISWNFHLVRARFIFGQCFAGDVTMLPVPRRYDYDVADWAAVYSYQYRALVKAVMLGC